MLAFGPSHPSYFEKSPCKNEDKGCEWQSILGHREKHVKNWCKFEEELNCEFCDSVTPTEQLAAHQNLTPSKDNWQEGCKKARVKCINCEDMITRGNLKDHLNLNKSSSPKEWLDGCQNARIKCLHCNEVLERQQLNEHLDMKHEEKQVEQTDTLDLLSGGPEMVTCTLCKRKSGNWKLNVKEKRMDIRPEEKHLALVVTMAWQAHDKWRELGLELEIDSSKLDELRDKHSGLAKGCFAEMMFIWLKSAAMKKSPGKLSTYRGLISALSCPTVGLKNIADSMEKSIKCEEAMITAAKVKCIFCDREVPHYLLSSHIKLDPTQGMWIAGCDRAKEKLTEGSRGQVKRKRGRDEESEEQIQPRKVARINE